MLYIREVQNSDAGSLMELYLEHLTTAPPEEKQNGSNWSSHLDMMIADPDYHILVGEEGGKVVTSVTLVIIRNLTHNLRPYSLIENVVTHERFRNHGYASALLDAASEIALKSGCYKIMLLTGSKQESTLRFYEKAGFNMKDKTGFIKWL